MTETQITPTQKIVAEVFAKATHNTDLDNHSESKFCADAKQAIIDAGLTVSDDDDLLIGFFAMGLRRTVAKEAAEKSAQAKDTSTDATNLGGLDLLDKLDAIDVKEVKTTSKKSKIPNEDRAAIAEILKEHEASFTPMLAEYQVFCEKEEALTESKPSSFSATIKQARALFGHDIDELNTRIAYKATDYFVKKYQVKTLDAGKIHVQPETGALARKWSHSFVQKRISEGGNVHPSRMTPFDLDEVLVAIELQLGSLDFGDLAIQEIFDIFHKKMGTDSQYKREVSLAKKKNYSKTVKIDFWGEYAWDSWCGTPRLQWSNQSELTNLIQVLRIFDTDGQSIESLELLDKHNTLPTEAIELADDWTLVKKIKFFRNGAIGITFKDGHTAARFVRETCKRCV